MLFFHPFKMVLQFCMVVILFLALSILSAIAQIATPVFQFAIFYNLNMEIAFGNVENINGPVFCNQSIWAGSSSVTFSSTVDAVGYINTTANDPFASNYTDSGFPTFTLPGQPVSGAGALNIQMDTNNNPNNVKAILNLPPPAYALGTAAAYSTNGQTYLANAADFYITNSASGTNSATPSGTNTFVYFSDGSLKLVPPNYYILKNPANFVTNWVYTNLTSGGSIGSSTNYAGNVRFAGYSFLTNVLFYDWREGWNGGSGIGGKGKAVQAVQFDVAKFYAWATNGTATNGGAFYDALKLLHTGHHINSIYVYNAVSLTAITLPAVRVVNGSKLPSYGSTKPGFTVATAFPLYVLGNYNSQDYAGSALGLYGTATATAHTSPAALMADSITILSTNWNDSVTNKLPASGNTTVNAAMLTGIVPSNPAISGNYSGGVENSLRFLEDWSANSGQTLTYNGSIVVMFSSSYATNYWQPTGNYYNAPTRHWSFDFNFTNGQSHLPPLTPLVASPTNPPAITTQPQNQTVAVGSNAVFNVTANGSSPLNYQWKIFNGTNILGATNASLTLTNVQVNQAGNYLVQVTNASGSVLSSNAVLTVVALPPVISTPPINQTVFVNSAVTFNVTASGSLPLNYQWNFNGTNIDGATNASLTLANVQTNQAGNYAVQVMNLFGSTNSVAAVLLVGLQPTIVSQPTNQTLMAGDTTIFDVVANGSMPLSYQWSFNGINLIGATNTSLILTNVQFEQGGNYTVQVTNVFGSITSSNAVLDVIPLSPVILTQPTDVTVGAGNTATFTVSAGGTLPLIYQWQKNGSNLTDGGNVSGAITTNLVLSDVQTNDIGCYSVVVTNNLGAATSRMAALIVNNTGGYIIAWGAGTNDSGYPNYGQSMIPPGLTNVTAVTGGQYHSVALKNDGTVVCWGQGTYGQTSVPAGLNNIVAISAGSMHTLALKSDGTVVAWGFDWNGQVDVPAGLNNVVAIAAGDTDSLALRSDGTTVSWGWNNQGQGNPMNSLTAIAAGGQFSLGLKEDGTVVGWGGDYYGQTDVPAGLTNVVAIAAGGYHSLALKADGTVTGWGSIWNGQNYVPVSVPPGLTNIIAISDGWYQSLALKRDGTVMVWGYNAWGQTNIPAGLGDVVNIASGYSHCLAVVNNNFPFLPLITSQPIGFSYVAGMTANFNVMADGTSPLNYQWQFNGTNLDLATNVTLTLTNVTVDQAGVYSVTVTNAVGSVTSSNAVLSVYASAASTMNGASMTADNNIQFTVAGVPGFNYAVLASTNLIDWVPLVTNTSPFIFTDTNTSSFQQQFYRSIYTP